MKPNFLFYLYKTSFLLLPFMVIATACIAQTTTINYTPDNGNFANPERGFYRYTDTYSSSPQPLTVAFLNNLYSTNQQSLIFRYIILDNFTNVPISNTFLTAIQNDFSTVRQAGFKIIPRFSYINSMNFDTNGNGQPPYGDAPKNIVLQHIAQLKPILQQNADVILTLQNGFWGVWGENFYSDYFGCSENAPLTTQNWIDRRQVTDSLLAALPTHRTISLRYPTLKAMYYNLNLPEDSITLSQAYAPNNTLSRLAAHNDCFLADYNDYTFADTLSEKPYWHSESRYMVMGGETCSDNATYTNCTNTMHEMERFHWTYCNDGYHPDVLQRWTNQGCMPNIKKRLGYRFELINATFPNSVAQNGTFNFTFQVRNVGFAAPIHQRKVALVLKNTITNTAYTIELPNQDPRYWFANGTYTSTETIALPNTIPCGNYQLFLYLPDPEPTLSNNPYYAIRMANLNMWENTSGYNNLQHILAISFAPAITGNNAVCPNSTQSYSVPTVAGSNYTWTVVGGTILSGQGTNQITVQWNNNTTGTVSIQQNIP